MFERFIVVATVFPVVLLAGCPGAVRTAGDFDGDWRFTGPTIGTACVRIADGRVAAWDAACEGSEVPLANSQQAAITDERVVWMFDAVVLGVQSHVTLDMRVQGDGSLSGTITLVAAGDTATGDAILVRQ